MSGIDNSLTFDVRTTVQQDMCSIRQDTSAMTAAMPSLKGHMTSFMTNEVVRDSMIAALIERLHRVETRLELREAD